MTKCQAQFFDSLAARINDERKRVAGKTERTKFGEVQASPALWTLFEAANSAASEGFNFYSLDRHDFLTRCGF